MNPVELFSLAFHALKNRKLRTTLTVLGITIGPATIVTLLAITQGFSTGLTEQFEKMGVSTIMVMPSGPRVNLTMSNVQEIQAIENVKFALPFYRFSVALTTGGTTSTVSITAIKTSELPNLLPGFSLLNGQLPEDYDLTGAVIGYNLAYPTDTSTPPITVGQTVTTTYSIRQFGQVKKVTRSFTVRGIANQFGQGIFLNIDDGIFIAFRAGQTLTGSTNIAGIYVVANGPEVVSEVSEAISSLSKNFRVMAVQQIVSTIETIIGGVNLLLGSVAFMSVVAAFFGIMTTMFTTVTERTREIGLLKALGYTNRLVMLIFLSEAILTGLIGGIIGSSLGAGLSFVVIKFFTGGMTGGMAGRPLQGPGITGPMGPSAGTSFNIVPVISPDLIGEAIMMAVGVATLAGLIPAWRASKLTPVEALRHE